MHLWRAIQLLVHTLPIFTNCIYFLLYIFCLLTLQAPYLIAFWNASPKLYTICWLYSQYLYEKQHALDYWAWLYTMPALHFSMPYLNCFRSLGFFSAGPSFWLGLQTNVYFVFIFSYWPLWYFHWGIVYQSASQNILDLLDFICLWLKLLQLV